MDGGGAGGDHSTCRESTRQTDTHIGLIKQISNESQQRRDSIVGQATPPGAESLEMEMGLERDRGAPTEIGAPMARDNQSKTIKAKRFSRDKDNQFGVESISLERKGVENKGQTRRVGVAKSNMRQDKLKIKIKII